MEGSGARCGAIFVNNGSGCVSGRPKNKRIRMRIRNTGRFTSSSQINSHKNTYKTVEIKAFLTIFAWWWKDPEPDPYLGLQIGMRIREAQKHTDPNKSGSGWLYHKHLWRRRVRSGSALVSGGRCAPCTSSHSCPRPVPLSSSSATISEPFFYSSRPGNSAQ